MEESKNIGGIDGQTPVVGANGLNVDGLQQGLAEASTNDPIEQGIPTPLKIAGKAEVSAPVASPKQQIAPVAMPSAGNTTSARVSPLADVPANASAGDSTIDTGKSDGAVAMQAPSPTQSTPEEGVNSDIHNPQPSSEQEEVPIDSPQSESSLVPSEPEQDIEEDEVSFGDPLINIRKNNTDDENFERNPLAQMKIAGEFLKGVPGRMRVY